jgi:hypothetical protein
LLLFAACGSLAPGGSGTETTTGIRGAIVNTQGDPQACVQVALLPADYNPVTGGSAVPLDTTDALGRYAFAGVISGGYSILAVHLDNRMKALVSGIHAGEETVTVPTCMLRTDGAVGYGQDFDGFGDYSDMGNVLDPGTSGFSVSAWIKRSDTDNIQTIIAKSNGGTPSPTYGWLVTNRYAGAC